MCRRIFCSFLLLGTLLLSILHFSPHPGGSSTIFPICPECHPFIHALVEMEA
jgi:hypothetical protein